MALNRKFKLKFISRDDIVPLTEIASQVTGLNTYDDIMVKELEML